MKKLLILALLITLVSSPPSGCAPPERTRTTHRRSARQSRAGCPAALALDAARPRDRARPVQPPRGQGHACRDHRVRTVIRSRSRTGLVNCRISQSPLGRLGQWPSGLTATGWPTASSIGRSVPSPSRPRVRKSMPVRSPTRPSPRPWRARTRRSHLAGVPALLVDLGERTDRAVDTE